MTAKTKRIAVIGGGISGLSAAFYLQKFSRERQLPVAITLFEGSGRLGGKIRTLRRDGCVIEQGPDSFLARKWPILELTRELGLEQELAPLNPEANKTYILHRQRLHPMPEGLMLGIPTRMLPFLTTGLISPLGKARAALDFVLPRKREKGDETLGAFLERRLGAEVHRHIAEPLLAGIYAGDTGELSLQATFPQFHEIERKHRSLMIGMMRSRRQQGGGGPAAQPLPPQLAGSVFLSYKRGLATLVETLDERLGAVQRVLGKPVAALAREEGAYRLRLSDGAAFDYDAVVLAVPNYEASRLLAASLPEHRLIDIPYASVANVVLAFPAGDLGDMLRGSGFLAPRGEGLSITACTWTSMKWPHTAPEHIALLRCYVGRAGDEAALRHDDGELTEIVRRDLKRTMGVNAKPLFVEVTRWNRAMPQYTLGHLERLEQFRTALAAQLPGVFATGAGFRGVGLPDCIAQGKQTADQTVQFLLRQRDGQKP